MRKLTMKFIRKTNTLVLILVMLLASSITAQTWEEIGINLPDGQIASANCKITFANKDTGWLYNEFYAEGIWHKQLYRTTDGAKNWYRVTLNNVRNYPSAIIFAMEPDFFYMINSDYYAEYPSDVLFTRDGGNTWTYKQIVNDGYTTIHFFDEEKGIIVGEHSWITKDGGSTWIRSSTISPPEDIYFHDYSLGWAVGYSPFSTDAGYIAKTTDGGNTWVYQDSMTFMQVDYYGVDFIDSLKGFAVGGSVSKTIDGGNNWDIITGVGGYDVGFLDERNGWISSAGNIFYTSDGGQTWAHQLDSLINYSLIKIIILKKDKVAYILGKSSVNNTATLLKADLNNISGVEEKKEAIPEELYLLQNFPNPFNPTTTIEYRIPKEGHVTLKVYDVLGKEITTIVNERKLPGTYKANFEGGELTSGVYITRLTMGKLSKSMKLILLK